MSGDLAALLQSGKFPPPPVDYEPGTPLALYGFTDGAVPREPGAVRLRTTADELIAEGLLLDGDLFSRADGDGQKLWELGDAFEFMFQLPGRRDYYEFQTAPTGFRLQLHIMDCRTFRAVPHEQKLCDLGMTAEHGYDPETRLWRARMRIPLAALGATRRELAGAHFIFVRQNHAHDAAKPEITASRVFASTAHDPENWHRLRNPAGSARSQNNP